MALTDSQRRNACDALKEFSHHRDMVGGSPGSAALDELQTLLAMFGLEVGPIPKEEPKVVVQGRTPQNQFADALNYASKLNNTWLASLITKMVIMGHTREVLPEVEKSTGFWLRKTEPPKPAPEPASLIPTDRLTPGERHTVAQFRASTHSFLHHPDRYTYKVGNIVKLLTIIDRLTPAPKTTA